MTPFLSCLSPHRVQESMVDPTLLMIGSELKGQAAGLADPGLASAGLRYLDRDQCFDWY